MSLSSRSGGKSRLALALCVVTVAAGLLWFGFCLNTAKAQVKSKMTKASTENLGGMTFPGAGVGNIPDGGPGCGVPAATNLDVTFNVSGVSSISDVEVDMNITHTWVGDVSATLIAPSGESHTLFKNTGWTDATSSCGDSSDLGGIYTFRDTAGAPNWWTEADNRLGAEILTPGAYRTTEAGGATQTMNPAPETMMNPAFTGTGTITGTWTLRFNDGGGGDTGDVSAANLTFNTSAVTPRPPQIDFDGDGKSDYSIVRDNTPPLSGFAPSGRRSIQELRGDPGFKPLQPIGKSVAPANHGTNLGWYIHNSSNNTARVQGFGQPATDFWVPEDYDNDGQDDIAVWRGVAPSGPNGGFFYTFTSSNSTVNEIDFGQQGDNPTVVGDYDGDGLADPAVYRCSAPGQCTFFYKGSAGGGEITYMPWGNQSISGDLIRPYPGDFDGDKKNDFAIFQDNRYTLYRSSDGGVEFISWGLSSDPVIAPGDYDGDGKTDFMNVRVNGNDIQWWLLDRNGNRSISIWGALVPGFSEFATPGDFDGDGTTDIGIWRRDDSSTSNSFFYTLRSSDGMFDEFEWGSAGDAPVPGWNTN